MKRSHLVLLALAHVLIATCAATEAPTDSKTDKATTKPAVTTETPKATETPKTTTTPTTTPTSKATSSAPTTQAPTTQAPTTKAKPTTEAPTNGTEAPTNGTEAPPTKRAPTKGPHHPTTTPLKAFTYDLTVDKDLCLRFYAALQVNFSYETSPSGNKIHMKSVMVNFTNTNSEITKIGGKCPYLFNSSRNASSLEIHFNQTYVLTFDFLLNTTVTDKQGDRDDHWYIANTTLTIDLSRLPDSAEKKAETLKHGANMSTVDLVPLDSYFVCNSSVHNLLVNTDGGTSKTHNATVTRENAWIEAFANVTKSYGKSSYRCDADFKTNNIVPIAVGCALAALVLVVLVAYLIGRSRNNKAGYQSV